ncbi:MAG: IclR family transcriptional regulator [Thermodesulforhabdaceae bacterium]
MQNDKISSLEKALRILKAFSLEKAEWGIRDLAAHLGFSPATVQRLVQTLKNHGFLDQDELTKRYRLGPVYFRFVEILQSQYPILKEALPLMRVLCSETGETTHLNVIDGRERLCIYSIESPQRLKASMPVGNRSPLYAGASSKCLLAFSPREFIESYLSSVVLTPLTADTITDMQRLREELSRIRSRGFATSTGERTQGLCSISVPVFGYGASLIAALSLAIPTIRFNDDEHKSLCLKKLLETGEKLSRKMGYSGELYPMKVESL